jgi:hypothetical protein
MEEYMLNISQIHGKIILENADQEFEGTAKQCVVISDLEEIAFDDFILALSEKKYEDCHFESPNRIKKAKYVLLRIGNERQTLYTVDNLRRAFSNAA